MNLLRGLAVLTLFQGIGEGISHIAGIPVPGPVIGMVLLFLALQFSHTETPAWLGRTGHSLIRCLSLMFLPACTGLFFLPWISPPFRRLPPGRLCGKSSWARKGAWE